MDKNEAKIRLEVLKGLTYALYIIADAEDLKEARKRIKSAIIKFDRVCSS